MHCTIISFAIVLCWRMMHLGEGWQVFVYGSIVSSVSHLGRRYQ